MVPSWRTVFGVGNQVKHLLNYGFVRFAAVGVVNSLVGLSIIYAAKFFFNISDVPANIVGYGVGLAVSFVLNRTWTFQHRQNAVRALARFLLIFVFAYLSNLLTLLFLVHVLHVNAYLAQALAMVPYTLVGFFGSKYFAFRHDFPPGDRYAIK